MTLKRRSLDLGAKLCQNVMRHDRMGFSPLYESDCPVRAVEVDHIDDLVACVAGVAVIRHEEYCVLVGREATLDVLVETLDRGGVDPNVVRRAFNADWCMPRPTVAQTRLENVRTRIVGADQIRKVIHEHFPQLQAPGDVQLKPSGGGLTLGGVDLFKEI